MAEQVLTEEDVEVIFARLIRGEKGTDIARDFVVSQQTVSAIRTGESWAQVTGMRAGDPRPRSHQGKGLTPADVLAIDSSLREGAPTTDLARAYGVAYSTIYAIKLGASWAWLTGRAVPERRTKK